MVMAHQIPQVAPTTAPIAAKSKYHPTLAPRRTPEKIRIDLAMATISPFVSARAECGSGERENANLENMESKSYNQKVLKFDSVAQLLDESWNRNLAVSTGVKASERSGPHKVLSWCDPSHVTYHFDLLQVLCFRLFPLHAMDFKYCLASAVRWCRRFHTKVPFCFCSTDVYRGLKWFHWELSSLYS